MWRYFNESTETAASFECIQKSNLETTWNNQLPWGYLKKTEFVYFLSLHKAIGLMEYFKWMTKLCKICHSTVVFLHWLYVEKTQRKWGRADDATCIKGPWLEVNQAPSERIQPWYKWHILYIHTYFILFIFLNKISRNKCDLIKYLLDGVQHWPSSIPWLGGLPHAVQAGHTVPLPVF